MRFFWKSLILLSVVFSPCLVGCSSQMSEEEALRREAEEEQEDESYEISPEEEAADEQG